MSKKREGTIKEMNNQEFDVIRKAYDNEFNKIDDAVGKILSKIFEELDAGSENFDVFYHALLLTLTHNLEVAVQIGIQKFDVNSKEIQQVINSTSLISSMIFSLLASLFVISLCVLLKVAWYWQKI